MGTELAQKGIYRFAEVAEQLDGLMLRDETFEQRRQQEYIDGDLLNPLADPTSQDLQAAVGHWADWDMPTIQNNAGARAIERVEEGNPDLIARHLAANEIHNHSMSTGTVDDIAKLSSRLPGEDTELDLSSADARVKALDNLTQEKQFDPYDPYQLEEARHAEDTCAASSLVGAALLSGGAKGGTEGLTTLMAAMDANLGADGDHAALAAQLGPLREKIAKGEPITTGDMHMLQRQLYNEMQQSEGPSSPAGIEPDTLKKFVGNSHELQEMMARNKLGVDYIANDPNRPLSTHAVLTIGGAEGKSGALYDPTLRDDGQIVTSPEELAQYKTATKANVL